MKSNKKSAGLLLFRKGAGDLEVLLGHMGGPFWEHKEEGAWSIPKGEFEAEQPLDAALREFEEETGHKPIGAFIELNPVKQPSGKTVYAWALEFDCDAEEIKSNTFSVEWPKGSGEIRDFPEIDRAAWLPLAQARTKILKGQVPFLDQLQERLGIRGEDQQRVQGEVSSPITPT